MKIGIAINSQLPALNYGGTERAALWLSRALAEMGHEVSLVCHPLPGHENSELKHAKCLSWPNSSAEWTALWKTHEFLHFMGIPPADSTYARHPYLVTIQGNGKVNQVFPSNTVFVSANHAKRHGWNEFVHNGLDPAEYPLSRGPRDPALLFLAKARWRVKNLRGALEISRRAGRPYWVIGGRRPWTPWGIFARHAKFFGEIGGTKKLDLIQRSSALLFPVIWDEPFGIAVTEALVCGTPVIASRRGSLPEIISPECGRLCSSMDEYLSAIEELPKFNDPDKCRQRVMDHFTHHKMAEKYLHYYRQILAQGRLREGEPRTQSET